MTTDYYLKADTLRQLTLPGESWQPVKETLGRYWISDMGRLATMNHYARDGHAGKVKIMKPAETEGYMKTMITINGKSRTIGIHRLVAEAFLGERPEGFDINHKDGVSTNNRLDNLEYCTHSENVLHSYRHGLQKLPKGSLNPYAKLTEEQVIEIRLRFKPYVVMMKDLTIEYGVKKATIKDVVTRKSWKHV